jgi:hypothetical protein
MDEFDKKTLKCNTLKVILIYKRNYYKSNLFLSNLKR